MPVQVPLTVALSSLVVQAPCWSHTSTIVGTLVCCNVAVVSSGSSVRAAQDLVAQPDSMIAPNDPGLPYYIAVDRVLAVGTRSPDEVVAQLRAGFTGKGALERAPARQVGGLTAAGVVVDDPPRTRHVYTICTYTRRAFPIRVTYDPDHEREALAAFDAVLDSWTWG